MGKKAHKRTDPSFRRGPGSERPSTTTTDLRCQWRRRDQPVVLGGSVYRPVEKGVERVYDIHPKHLMISTSGAWLTCLVVDTLCLSRGFQDSRRNHGMSDSKPLSVSIKWHVIQSPRLMCNFPNYRECLLWHRRSAEHTVCSFCRLNIQLWVCTNPALKAKQTTITCYVMLCTSGGCWFVVLCLCYINFSHFLCILIERHKKSK